MKAAVMDGVRQPLSVRDVPEPTVPPHGAMVRVEANGICRSDWHVWTGDWTWFGMKLKFPHVLGHELCGVVEEVGADVRRIKRGDRVIVPFSQGEGTCEWCRGGTPNLCDTPLTPGFAYWGGYGRFVAAPYADVNLVALPETIPFVDAAALGCRFMTAFHGVVDRAQVQAGEWVAVHGCGGVGLSAVHIASAMGANVIAVDMGEEKLAMAQQLGAMATIDVRTTNPTKAIRDITHGGAHVAVDALGIADTCRNAVASLRKRGRHLQLGMTSAKEKGEIALPIDLIVLKEISVIGSAGMPAPRFESMLRMVTSGKLSPGRLVNRSIGLADASAVLESMDSYATTGVTVITDYN